MEPVPVKVSIVTACYRGQDKVKEVMDMVVRWVCIILKVNCSSKLYSDTHEL